MDKTIIDTCVDDYNTNMEQMLQELSVLSDKLYEIKLVTDDMVSNLNFYKRLCGNAYLFNKTYLIESMAAWIIDNPEFVTNLVKRNVDFFCEYDYAVTTKLPDVLELITCIKNVFQLISQDNQEIIFEYVEVLAMTAIKYIEVKYKK